MQPLNRKNTSHKRGRVHVRTQLAAKLGWLQGYPVLVDDGRPAAAGVANAG